MANFPSIPGIAEMSALSCRRRLALQIHAAIVHAIRGPPKPSCPSNLPDASTTESWPEESPMKIPDQPDQPQRGSGPDFPVVLQTDENLDDFLDVIAAGIDHSSSHGDNHSSRPPAS